MNDNVLYYFSMPALTFSKRIKIHAPAFVYFFFSFIFVALIFSYFAIEWTTHTHKHTGPTDSENLFTRKYTLCVCNMYFDKTYLYKHAPRDIIICKHSPLARSYFSIGTRFTFFFLFLLFRNNNIAFCEILSAIVNFIMSRYYM